MFLEQCIYKMGDSVPGTYQLGFGKSLHAYVCKSGQGRDESQESREEEK